MTQPLFHVVVLHHVSDMNAGPRVDALRRAFECVRPEGDTPQFAVESDPWSLVSFAAYSDPAEFEKGMGTIAKRALFILLVTEKMAEDPAWMASLEILALALPKDKNKGTRNALCFASFEGVEKRLPKGLSSRQVPESSVLGERRMRPHTLALLALYRARLLLGADPNKNTLKLFISHAKADGLFLARSLVALIGDVPELEKWYDAVDIQSGDDWSEDIEAAASNCVFIAIRTEAYDQSHWCRREFETALAAGVPIVVVDALLRPAVTPSTLPFAAMPNVRIPDGNTHRVLTAAFREHLRLLLVETLVADQTPPEVPTASWRVWPRLPTLSAIQKRAATLETREFWLLPQALQATMEFTAARDWLTKTGSLLRLEAVDSFLLLAGSLGSKTPPASAAGPDPTAPINL